MWKGNAKENCRASPGEDIAEKGIVVCYERGLEIRLGTGVVLEGRSLGTHLRLCVLVRAGGALVILLKRGKGWSEAKISSKVEESNQSIQREDGKKQPAENDDFCKEEVGPYLSKCTSSFKQTFRTRLPAKLFSAENDWT